MPKRVVVYRNGISEGNFEELFASEIGALRKAFSELRREPCPREDGAGCMGLGCVWCTPPVTYIVALSQHNLQMAPAEPVFGKNHNLLNVPSGTCIDHTVTPHTERQECITPWPDSFTPPPECQLQVFEQSNSSGFDFLLTAQGGRKGTSKPIFYRVVSKSSAFGISFYNLISKLTELSS